MSFLRFQGTLRHAMKHYMKKDLDFMTHRVNSVPKFFTPEDLYGMFQTILGPHHFGYVGLKGLILSIKQGCKRCLYMFPYIVTLVPVKIR